MYKRAFALLLAVTLVLTALSGFSYGPALQKFPEPAAAPAAMPGIVAPLADTYSITMTSTGPGTAELYADTAGARESVYFLADPEPGCKVSFDHCGYYMDQYAMELHYIGRNIYEIVMPDGDVLLDLQFVEITTPSHDVKLTISGGGTATVDQKTAKNGESLFLEAQAEPGWSLESVRARAGDTWQQGYYLSKGSYEIFMPDDDLEILVEFKRNGPYTVTPVLDTEGGIIELSHESAYELEEITVTAVPDRGYRTSSVGCRFSAVTQLDENVYIFSMPRLNEEVHASFEPIVYPVCVTTELPMGGTARLDTEGAVIGNYCIASRSMVEIAGKLSENQNHPRLHLLKKAACNVNNGQEVWLLDYDYRKPGFNIPKGLYFKSAFFSSEEENPLMPMRTVGLFNVLDKKMKMSLNAAKLGLDKQKTWLITNIWTHEIFEISPGKSVSFQLEAHGSMLLGIAEKSLVLLDANVKINTVIKKDNSLSLDCAFSVPDAEFLFSEKIKNVSFNGKNIKTEIRENSCKFDLKKAGIYTFEF